MSSAANLPDEEVVIPKAEMAGGVNYEEDGGKDMRADTFIGAEL
jgi:hypothetical protein